MPCASRSGNSAGRVSVGLISDTHGLLRPEALEALRGSRHIVHAGDIGDPAVLEALARIAPVTAVRGNNDKGSWARKLRETEVLELGRTRLYVIHNLSELALDPAAAGIHVVVAGHSHRPAEELRDGVLYVNPGSAGPRRFKLPVSVARLALPARKVVFKPL
jgi:putative phosphoesterase